MLKRHVKQFNKSLSPFGLGVMRFQQNADGSFPSCVHSVVSSSIEKGINYFDTGYTYMGGHSEGLIRDEIVIKNPRDSFYIADKLPVWQCENREDMEKIFNTQLERLGVEYIDFYLLHALNRRTWKDAYERGVLDFLEGKKREGRITHVGFSLHDTLEPLINIESSYDWDFIQLQINYFDWFTSSSKECYEHLVKRDIPCMVMEPIGGGRLSTLPQQAVDKLNALRSGESASSWALRFVAALPNVAVTLSGVSTMDQLDENIKTFETIEPLTSLEFDTLRNVVKVIESHELIPCSGCAYCMNSCVKNIDIVEIFKRYNSYKMPKSNIIGFRLDVLYFGDGTKTPAPTHINSLDGRRADSCIKCGKCSKRCPQGIDIPKELEQIHNEAVRLAMGIDVEILRGKSGLTLFGSGDVGRWMLCLLNNAGIKVSWFCDNSPQKWGNYIDGIEIINPQSLIELNAEVLITSSIYYNEIKTQLENMGVPILN